MEYDDLMNAKEIYSLIALTSVYNKFYAQVSHSMYRTYVRTFLRSVAMWT
jgi:hypothetical protein